MKFFNSIIFATSGPSNTFISSWSNFCRNFRDAKLNDSILGVTTLILLLTLKVTKHSTSLYLFQTILFLEYFIIETRNTFFQKSL